MIALVVTFVVLSAAGMIWGLRDYRAWIALGPGGLPQTFAGWVATTRLRLRKRDPIETSLYRFFGDGRDDPSFIDTLPRRAGPRPRVAPWPIPHRQIDQFIGTESYQKLAALFDSAVEDNSAIVEYRLSFYEKHNLAVTLRDHKCGHAHAMLGQGEIAHIHPSDGSMHMIFTEADAKRVIEAGWGERHPLAGVRPRLPTTYIYIYPPRDDVEVLIVESLLKAAIKHMSTPSCVAT